MLLGNGDFLNIISIMSLKIILQPTNKHYAIMIIKITLTAIILTINCLMKI